MNMLSLDIGVGTNKGYKFNPHARINEEAVFIDKEIPDNSLQEYGEWIVTDVNHGLPFRDNIFKKIYASHIIEHLIDWQRFLRECYRILDYDGILELKTPNILSKNTFLDPDHKHRLNIITLIIEMKKIGYHIRLQNQGGTLLGRWLSKMIGVLTSLLSDEIVVYGVK